MIKTLPCIPHVRGVSVKIPIVTEGFTPGGIIRVYTNTGTKPPLLLMSAPADATGGFGTEASPPLPGPFDRNLQTFNLFGEDRTSPAAPIIATTQFQVVRFGMTRSPTAKRPGQTVKYTARGYEPGKRVYAHFRYRGITRRTVSLGIAKGPCGITSRKMRALPTKVRYGTWRAYIDQSRRFSSKTRPQWIDPFRITRVVRRR